MNTRTLNKEFQKMQLCDTGKLSNAALSVASSFIHDFWYTYETNRQSSTYKHYYNLNTARKFVNNIIGGTELPHVAIYDNMEEYKRLIVVDKYVIGTYNDGDVDLIDVDTEVFKRFGEDYVLRYRRILYGAQYANDFATREETQLAFNELVEVLSAKFNVDNPREFYYRVSYKNEVIGYIFYSEDILIGVLP